MMIATLITNTNRKLEPHLRTFEIIGVCMRIVSFTLVSWLGSKSPFMFVWIFNTIDAMILSWCSMIKKDPAYILLNVFWILVGVVGIIRSLPQ